MRPDRIVQRASAPALGTLVQVPAGEGYRHVYGTYSVAGAVGLAASVEAQVETAPLSATYETVTQKGVAVGVLALASDCFHFVVPAGCRYRFVGTGGVGVTETVLHYSYADL